MKNNSNPNPKPDPFIISYLTLRRAIGILGITLPAFLILGTVIIGKCTQVQDSISHYYFTIMGDLLVGILCAVAIFLLSYRGYEKIDNITSSLAGIFAMGVAFLATSHDPDAACTVRSLPDISWRIAVHYISAALFFITLSFISIFLFTKSKGIKTGKKLLRNKIYVACGIVMLVAIAIIFALKVFPAFGHLMAKFKPVFWLEWIALIAFGTSWLVKGKFLFGD